MSLRIVEAFVSSDSVRIVPIRNYYRFEVWRKLSAACYAVWRVWRLRNELTLVHLQVTGGRSIERDLPVVLMGRLVSLPVVLQFHGAGQSDDYESGSSLHKWFYRMLVGNATAVAVLGRHAEEWLETVAPGVTARVINNWVESEPIVSALGDGPPRIVFAGRLGVRKGIYDLVEALDQLSREGMDFQAEIAGDGETEEVASLVGVNEQLRDKVNVLGWLYSGELRKLISRSWLFVLPSYAEGMPLAVLEAMACGRAVVGTQVNEMDQLVSDGESGILLKPGDIGGLAEGIRRICADRELAASMGQRGWEIARARFTEELCLKALVDLWQSAVDA
jgi:glycosyltransferase involved in cell wall biosynthesis